MFATLTNVGWIIYSAVYANLAIVIISIVGLVVTFIFWLRWSREQKAKDGNQINERGPALRTLMDRPRDQCRQP